MEASSKQLVDRWRHGDDEAATELFNRYFERLLRLVDSRLARHYRARFDAADICQSALRSMFRRVRAGEYSFEHDGGVWALIAEIALNKLRNRFRHEHAYRRDPGREQKLDPYDDSDIGFVHQLSREPSGEDVAVFRDLLTAVMKRLKPEERRYLVLQMRGGYSQQDIADILKLCTRTVRRISTRVREELAGVLESDDMPGQSDTAISPG